MFESQKESNIFQENIRTDTKFILENSVIILDTKIALVQALNIILKVNSFISLVLRSIV